jgi:hypothetical protein
VTGMMRQLAHTGDLTPMVAMFQGRGGGSGFGPPPAWNPRPGEQAIATGGRGGGGAARGAAAPAAPGAAPGAANAPAAALDPSMFQTIMPLFQIPGRAPSAGGFGLEFLQTLGFGNAAFAAFGGGGSGVATGDYVAVMSVGGKTLRQKVRVERGGATPQ